MFTLIIEDKHGGIADEYSFEEGEFYVGRSHTSDIILPSDNVSRRHARLYTVDGRCYIEDLNSSNGVFVNGRRIHEVYQIQRSAQVKIGDYYLHIESDAEQPEEEERTFCRLVGRNLAFAGQVFRVQRKVNLIGRGKDCTITIIDPSVSRIHTKLSVERSGALTLEDLKSSNGTFVNDERIEVATINDRDVIRFGNVEFLVELEGAGASGGGRAAKPARPERAERHERAERAERPERGDRGDRGDRHHEPVAPPSDRRYPTMGMQSFEDDWAPRKSKPKTLWLVLSLLGGLLVLGTILFIVFKDDIVGKSEPAKPPEVVAPAVDPKVEQEARERERRQQEIASLVELGNERVKNKQWDLALEAWTQVVDRDPLNAKALKAINQIKVWKKHKQLLDEARELKAALQRGKAAKMLREIDVSSVYFQEAQQELQQLVTAKQTMIMTADNRLRQKDCEGALEQLKEVQQIDPRDTSVLDKIDEIEKMQGSKKCK
ncbi:MAG: FHA domain-containing protein [Myxococcales bacterium]|nr:FHA domain-containing protein [Myxococcales bacterium]MCB9735635.1 FHA domain-containing protein [Deltaproteobacteria bacterium]